MKGYGIYVKNDLLDPKHFVAMGGSVWLYLWMLDKITSINEDGVGKVLGGKPLKHSEVDLDIPKRTYTRYIKTLVEGGYITALRTPYGHVFTVKKAVKIFKNRESGQNGRSIESGQNGRNKEDNTAIDNTYFPKTSLGECDNPKKDMSWNNKADDYEEGTIDLDGNGEIVEEKVTPRRKYPNAPAVRKLFQEILGKNEKFWKVNPHILTACERLYTDRGLDKIRNALEYYRDHQDERYCPDVSNPKKLEEKYSDLSKFKVRNGN